ncbi:hypothetical protein PENSPDRAFT_638965 [Peniophora sp. CONT]|nr:hypothetical protein PENSPDRAFT_638965 [Peniophora sp. CONT]
MSTVKRTYSSRSAQLHRSSSPSGLDSSPPHPSLKRPLAEPSSLANTRPLKRSRTSTSDVLKPTPKKSGKNKKPQTKLTQLHFAIDSSILKTCAKCNLTYTKGAPEDESLHRAHCARVQRGAEWGREEQREAAKAGVLEIETDVKLKDGRKGRIIAVRAESSGKIGSKIAMLLETISLNLSSPPLSDDILRVSKLYLFLLPTSGASTRETIAGCVVAQQIETAMAIAPPSDSTPESSPSSATLVVVDTDTGLHCLPAPLPTSMGIPRLFVPTAYRRAGVARTLLDAAARTFVHGCKLDPRAGDVAFTQPTQSGRAVMENWGRGGVRIYQE